MANTSLMEYLNGIATAVQAKTGSTKKIKLKDIASEIAKIDTFGTHEFLDPITVTTNGVIDVTNYSSINVNVADVDDLAAYFANDEDGYYSVVYKDYGTHWNAETQQNETIGYTSGQFEQGAHNFACLQYVSSGGIHNESLYFGQLDIDEIAIPNRNLSDGTGNTAAELEIIQLAAGSYRTNTHLAFYSSSGYVDVYNGIVSSGDILVFDGDGFSSLSNSMSSYDVLKYDSDSQDFTSVSLYNRGTGLINNDDEIVQFDLDTNNIMYRLSNSTIYNDALHNYEVTYYDKTETDTYKIKTRDLSENNTSVLFYNENQNDGNGTAYASNEINTVLFKDLYGGGGDLNKALYPSRDQYGNYKLQIGKIGYNSSSSTGESYLLAEWANPTGGTYIGSSNISGGTLVYLDNNNRGLSTFNVGPDSNGETIIYGVADDENNSVIPTEITFPNHKSIFYYNSSGEAYVESLQNNIAHLQGSNVYVQGFADTDVVYYNNSGEFTISTLGSNEVVHQSSSSGMEVESMNSTSVGYINNGSFTVVDFNNSNEDLIITYNTSHSLNVDRIASDEIYFKDYYSYCTTSETMSGGKIAYYNGSHITADYMSNSAVGYINNGSFTVVDFNNSGYTYLAYYNGSNIAIESMSEYDSSWSYDSSSQNVYGKIYVNGSLVNITEDMVKALVDAGFLTPANAA